MKFSALRTIMRQQLATNNVLEEDRITLKTGASWAEKPEAWAKTSLARRDSSQRNHQNAGMMMESNRVADSASGSASSSSSSSAASSSNATCANMLRMNTSGECRDSSKQQQTASGGPAAAGGLLEKVYTMTRRRHVHEDAGQSYAKAASRGAVPKFAKRSKASYNTSQGLFKPALVCLVAMLALTSSCLLAVRAAEGAAAATLDGGAGESGAAKAGHGHEAKQQQPSDRSDAIASKPADSIASGSSTSAEKSIVASLSSAVATAAAAAAVAAAQSSLSGTDARSLVANSLQRHHHNNNHNNHAQRSPGMNLAIKLADTIPEVPYNILHNMKKLDHAAPFYNVPNKLSGSTTKESSQSLLASALQASGSLGGAAEQLAALFRSPLWKRLADGYGEFASEFRSRFRAPGAAPMKGPSGSGGSTMTTTKLLRDISVPALLMLLASSVSGADWRPVRTRRKSFAPVDGIPPALAGALAPNAALQMSPPPSLAELKPLQYFPTGEQPQAAKPSADLMSGESAASASWLDQARSRPGQFSPLQHQQQQQQQREQQQAEPAQVVRPHDAALAAAMEGGVASAWLSGVPPLSGAAPQSALAMSGGGQDQNQLYYGYQPAASFQQQQQQQPVKRSDDEFVAAPADGNSAGGQAGAPSRPTGAGAHLFSSLTSELALGQAKLMSKLFNANVASDGNSYRMTSLADGLSKVSPTRRNLLSDKQRYSLVELAGEAQAAAGGASEPKVSSTAAKPFLSAVVAQAMSSVLGAPQPARESGSPLAAAAGRPAFFTRANLQQLIGEQQTINHEEALERRRRPQQRDGSAAEQRDLTKLLPESWREVVKRTMSSVQQQANTQWKSIEGQLANWVQDKLKTVAGAGALPSASSSSSSSSASAASAAPISAGLGSNAPPAPVVANMLASMSSTALNILGLNKNANSSTHSHSSGDHHHHHHASSAAKVEKSAAPAAAASGSESVSANQRGKLEKKQSGGEQQQQQPAKGALASVASALVKSLTNRQSSSPTTPSSPLSPTSPKSHPNVAPSSSLSPSTEAQSPAADKLVVSAASGGGIASKYPTLTGAQTEPERPTAAQTSDAAAASQS